MPAPVPEFPSFPLHENQFDVLVVIDHYLPGRLAGGPVTTISNMVQALGNERRFLIVTQDHDLDGKPHRNVQSGQAYLVAGTPVLYLSRKDFTPATFQKLLTTHHIPHLYLNSFFAPSTIRTLLYHRLRPLPAKVVLAPRGEFSSGALALKSLKKQAYLKVYGSLNLGRGIEIFQASSELEERDLWRVLGPVRTGVAPDVPQQVRAAPEGSRCHWDGGVPRFIFLSRITPKKNLSYALERLNEVPFPCQFHIYGPLEDKEYWATCQRLMAQLPDQVEVKYCGTVEHERVAEVFREYDAFLFPTAGENYGHVIFESLAAGCPVILSDQTPWRDLAREGVGWVIPLEHPSEFVKALNGMADSTPEENRERGRRCVEYARQVATDPQVLKDNLALFPLTRNR